MAPWVKHQRRGGALPDPVPAITLRRQQIALNAAFVAKGHLEDKGFVTIFVDPEAYRLGLKFGAKAADADAVHVTYDGGQKGSGRVFQATALMKHNGWLAATASVEDSGLRRFEPTWDHLEGMWVISVAPPFERRVSDRSQIPANVTGIYRYRRGDEIVYIGRGAVRSRLGSSERQDWDFETVEYSIVPNEQDQVRWETFWLDRFVEANGKLPIYNRIGGKKT